MKHSVSVRLGAFAIDALAGKVGNGNRPAAADVERAIQFYLGDKGRQGVGWTYPAFLREQGPAAEVEFELSVEDALWRLLQKEAASQDVAVDRLLEHATLYYVAELDSGRVAERMLGKGKAPKPARRRTRRRERRPAR